MINNHTITINGKRYPNNTPVRLLESSPASIKQQVDEAQKLNHIIAEKNKELIRCYNLEAKLTAQVIELRMKLKELNQ